jgi:hypothetical protein
MDYLIKYTQDQCDIFHIPVKSLPVDHDGFNFLDMEWRGGGYYDLPENPLKPGEPVVLVPKRFLRAPEINADTIESKVKGILSQDPELVRRFGGFIHKKVSEIDIEDIRRVFLTEDSIFKKYFEILSKNRSTSYDFENDLLKILSIKTYSKYFDSKVFPSESEFSCEDLSRLTLEFITIVKDHFSRTDGWKDAWRERDKRVIPCKEAVFGRIFRGMGNAYFSHLPRVTFESEVDMGNGPVDFKIIYKDCRIVIELKRLLNSSYLQGVQEQLPDYAYLSKATRAIYITGQHYTPINHPKNHHDNRIKQIEDSLSEIEDKMKAQNPNFKKLTYINISSAPHPSSSKIEIIKKT